MDWCSTVVVAATAGAGGVVGAAARQNIICKIRCAGICWYCSCVAGTVVYVYTVRIWCTVYGTGYSITYYLQPTVLLQ
jgi:hypothetical protein